MNRITIETQYGIYTVEESGNDLTVSEMMHLVKRVLIATGYHKDNIDEYIPDE